MFTVSLSVATSDLDVSLFIFMTTSVYATALSSSCLALPAVN
jgi:hypothetical protein